MRPLHTLRHWYNAIAVLVMLSGMTIVSTPVYAQSGSATSSASPSDATPSIGQQIEVTISIDVSGVNPPDDALGSFTGSLDWNPAVLAYDGNSGILAGFTGVVNDTGVSSGHIAFNGAQPAGARGSIAVLRITFNVTGAGTSSLDLAYSAMAAAGTFKNVLPLLTVNDGQVQVEGTPTQYTLTVAVDPVGGGTTNPAVGSHVYDSGTAVNVTASPAAGYGFDHWSGACTGSAGCQVTVDGDKSVTAHFVGIPYELTIAVDPVGGGTTSPAVGVHTYAVGAVVHITAAPAAGYAFDHWSGACTGTGACQVAMNADKSVAAHFSEITYYALTIEVDPVDGGTTDPEVGQHTYPQGTVVDITAMPYASYEFDRWRGACKGRDPCQVTMNADKAVTASFEELLMPCYTLTLSHTGQGSDLVAAPANSTGCPLSRYIEGETINLSGAVPDPGWRISAWQGTSQDNSTADTNSLTMPAGAHAASVTYKADIYIPVIFGSVTIGEPVPSQIILGENEAIAASGSSPDTGTVDNSPAKVPVQQGAEEQDLTFDPAVIGGNEATASSKPEPDSGALAGNPSQVATQQTAGEQGLIADVEHPGGNDLASVIRQRSWMLPLLFVLAVLAVVVGLAVLVILVVWVMPSFHTIKHKFAGNE